MTFPISLPQSVQLQYSKLLPNQMSTVARRPIQGLYTFTLTIRPCEKKNPNPKHGFCVFKPETRVLTNHSSAIPVHQL